MVTAWYHLGLWREIVPKWMSARMGKGTQQLLIRGRSHAPVNLTGKPQTGSEWLETEGIYSYLHSPQNSAWESWMDLWTRTIGASVPCFGETDRPLLCRKAKCGRFVSTIESPGPEWGTSRSVFVPIRNPGPTRAPPEVNHWPLQHETHPSSFPPRSGFVPSSNGDPVQNSWCCQ